MAFLIIVKIVTWDNLSALFFCDFHSTICLEVEHFRIVMLLTTHAVKQPLLLQRFLNSGKRDGLFRRLVWKCREAACN
jgi:hypothetical protein